MNEQPELKNSSLKSFALKKKTVGLTTWFMIYYMA